MAPENPTFGQENAMLRHVVLFQWKPETPPEVITEIEETLCSLTGKIPEIAEFEWGTDVGVPGLSRGFTHCLVVSFRSEADRDVYLPHPDHKAFIAMSAPHRENLLTFDYWVKN